MIDASKYTIQLKLVEIEGENFYQAKIREFPYLDEYAESATEAYGLALDAIRTSIDALRADGKEIPCPCNDFSADDYSGRVTLRLPKTLHASLAQISEYEGISLNQLIVAALSDFNGFNHSYYNEPIHEQQTVKTQVTRAVEISRPRHTDTAEEWDFGWNGTVTI